MKIKNRLTNEQIADAARLKNIYTAKKKELNINNDSIAEMLGVSQGAIGHYLNGRNALNAKAAAAFAEALQVKVSDFSITLANEIAAMSKSARLSEQDEFVIKIAGEAEVTDDGRFRILLPSTSSYLKFFGLKNTYCIRIKGEGLYPRIANGEFVILNPDAEINATDDVLVKTAEGFMLKRFDYLRDGIYRLSNIAPHQPPITIDKKDVEFIHKAEGILTSSWPSL